MIWQRWSTRGVLFHWEKESGRSGDRASSTNPRRHSLLLLALCALLFALPSLAQTPPTVLYQEDFQSYSKNANPPGWVDSAVGVPAPRAQGLWKTDVDPTEGNKGTNVVYGTRQSSGRPDGNTPRIGTFSTLSTDSFAGLGRFEFRGRMIRTNDDARIGVTFFSGYPQSDSYYLIGLWSHPDGSAPTMQLFRFGASDQATGNGVRHGRIHEVRPPGNDVSTSSTTPATDGPTGVLDSNFTPPTGQWVRFLVQVDDVDGETHVRARFWLDGTTEPDSFQIDAHDASTGRLAQGHIGLWGAVRGSAYFDDLWAKSPIDVTPPTIAFHESNEPFSDGAKLNRDATPEIIVTDDIDPHPTYTATLDGQPYTSLTPVTAEGFHTLAVVARDEVGNTSNAQISFLVDKTPPVIALNEGDALFPTGGPFGHPYFNRDVLPTLTIEDISSTTIAATLDGQPYAFTTRTDPSGKPLPVHDGVAISAEGDHTLSITVTDAVNWSTSIGPFVFTIDKTPPVLAFTSPADGTSLSTPRVTLAGTSQDSAAVMVNDLPATVDSTAGTFSFPDFALLEGRNTLVATGTDRAGNTGSATIHLNLDTRAPEVSISSPMNRSCVDATSLTVAGAARDESGATVKIEDHGPDGAVKTVDATVDATTGAFTATIDSVAEGEHQISILASDSVGHTATASVTVEIDRTPPVIEVTEGGAPFTATVLNRAVSLFVRAIDADPDVAVTATLDGQPWASGASIDSDGKHTLEIHATDCAGHTTSKTVSFTIDRAAPTIHDITPADGSTLGSVPLAVTGHTDTDVTDVQLQGPDSEIFAPVEPDGSFTLNSVPFAEGVNKFTIKLTDHGGNVARIPYTVTIHTEAPAVQILENGTPIQNGASFNRPLTPSFRASDPKATITVTLDDNPFTIGSAISAEGAHVLVATAVDGLDHVSSSTVHFTIDTTPPVVTITTPQPGIVEADHVDVAGNAGDSVSVNVNGVNATLAAGGAFSATVPLELGENAIVATGRDAAGNVGRAEVDVTRGNGGPAIILTSPIDGTLTNRTTTVVTGKAITPGAVTKVSVERRAPSGEWGPVNATPDAAGAFRVPNVSLVEGDNEIVVTATASPSSPLAAHSSSLSVHVTADLTPPTLTILADGNPLEDQSRFATGTTLTVESADASTTVVPTTSLFVDGERVTPPATVSAEGGHSALAIATDAAGNQRRVERAFTIGGSASAPVTCSITNLDPANGSVIAGTSTHLAGRTTAPAVTVNGTQVPVSDGSFCTTVNLPSEGENAVTVGCASSTGDAIGAPTTIALTRSTGSPSLAITSPAEGAVVITDTVDVAGTASADALDINVNGVAARVASQGSGQTFAADAVRLNDGLNIIVARAHDSAMRSALATRRLIFHKAVPAIAITSPVGVPETGAKTVEIRGTWSNLDPSTIDARDSGGTKVGAASATTFSDTNGSFVIHDVALQAGTNVITVAGTDSLGRETTAIATVTRTDGKPSIRINSPQDNSSLPASAGTTVTVTGTATAAAGSIVEVNGTPATLNASSQFPAASSFTATVPLSELAATPIVARVTEPAGASATDVVTVTKLADAPQVSETFPVADATEVDPAALVLVSFSNPMQGSTIATAFSLVDHAGAVVPGTKIFDRDVLSFAPAAALHDGEKYTIRVTTAAKDLGGTPLAKDFTASFTVASTAPSTAPTMNPVDASCGASFKVTGTAPAGARLRLDSGSLTLFTDADETGAYSFTLPFTGRSGYQLVRVRIAGSDGSLSPAAAQCVKFSCEGTRVDSAVFDRSSNKLTIDFSDAVDASSISVGETGTVRIKHQDGHYVAGTVTSPSPASIVVTPAEDLTGASFDLTVTTGVNDAAGKPLAAAYSQSFHLSGSEPAPGNGEGVVSGHVLSGSTGRPLNGVMVEVSDPVNAFSTKKPKKEGPK